MQVKILGNGGAFSIYPTAYLLNEHILVDAGYPIISDLIKTKEIDNIDKVCITHFHQDHVSGLESLIFYKRFSGQRLTIYASEYFLEYYKVLMCSKDNDNNYIQDFEFVELKQEIPFNIIKKPIQITDEVSLTFIETPHVYGNVQNFSFLFVEADSTVIITGDVDMPIEFPKDKSLTKNEIIFHDMGWTGLPESDRQVHPTEEQVFEVYGDDDRVIGIHTDSELKHFKKANRGDVFSL